MQRDTQILNPPSFSSPQQSSDDTGNQQRQTSESNAPSPSPSPATGNERTPPSGQQEARGQTEGGGQSNVNQGRGQASGGGTGSNVLLLVVDEGSPAEPQVVFSCEELWSQLAKQVVAVGENVPSEVPAFLSPLFFPLYLHLRHIPDRRSRMVLFRRGKFFSHTPSE